MRQIVSPTHAWIAVAIVVGFVGAACNQVQPAEVASGLNDTGITTCSNLDTSGLLCNDAGSGTSAYPGQDAEHGRDAVLDDDSDGRAGFSFTKLGTNGRPLVIQDGTWADLGYEAGGTRWSCVRDEITGLTWEVKANDQTSLHHKEHMYTWYNPDDAANGGTVGTPGGGPCNGTVPAVRSYTGCDSYSFAEYVNDSGGLCGFTDWRIPTREELRSIEDYSVSLPGPTIDTEYFPNTVNGQFWSISPGAEQMEDAWKMSFSDGSDDLGSKSSISYVRLVRGTQ